MNRILLTLLAAGLAALTAACGRAGGSEAAMAHSSGKADNRLEQILADGKLVIGISADYAPFAFPAKNSDGTMRYEGSDIRLGEYIAEQLDVEAEFTELEMQECLEAVKAGAVDLALLGMLPEAERLAYVDFTDPYYQPGRQVLLVKRSQRSQYAELADLEGATVAARYGTLQAQLVTEQLTKSYMELVDTISEGIELVNSGRADALVLDEQVTEDILEEYSALALASVELEYEQEGVVGGVTERETEFLEAVNEIIGEVVDEGLYLEWMDAAIRAASPQGSSGASSAAGNS